MITTDNSRREEPAGIAEQIAEGCRSVRSGGFEIELDRGRAIDEIIRRARPGDTVLLAGKGHETYQEAGDMVMPFDDREHARETLAALGYGE
jgi:UDP-N-acetylmuramoyl-L-alanyl-D-glutamate--2,6-diaminopimelate ligase